MPAASPKPTDFMNVKRRVIFKTARGKYLVKTDKGIKYAQKNAIPSPIRPKLVRKERKNAGEARGKYAARIPGVRVHHVKRKAYIGPMFEGYAPVRGRGRPRKHLVSPLGNFGIAALFGGKPVRKTRANAGGKRVKKQPVKRMLMF